MAKGSKCKNALKNFLFMEAMNKVNYKIYDGLEQAVEVHQSF